MHVHPRPRWRVDGTGRSVSPHFPRRHGVVSPTADSFCAFVPYWCNVKFIYCCSKPKKYFALLRYICVNIFPI